MLLALLRTLLVVLFDVLRRSVESGSEQAAGKEMRTVCLLWMGDGRETTPSTRATLTREFQAVERIAGTMRKILNRGKPQSPSYASACDVARLRGA
jgi:hypothetical protein